MLIATIAVVVLGTVVAGLFFVLRVVFRLWNRAGPGRAERRSMVVATIALLVFLPCVYVRAEVGKMLLARVPAPLHVAVIEYRNERSWGLGFMPGDNETGFVVYRLTEASAAWARAEGSNLRDRLLGGSKTWRPTPVDDVADKREWHPYDDDPDLSPHGKPLIHPPTIQEYLGKYGFSIEIEAGLDAEADRSIQTEGSVYSYGRGGSVTIVDPKRGKVFFAYAG